MYISSPLNQTPHRRASCADSASPAKGCKDTISEHPVHVSTAARTKPLSKSFITASSEEQRQTPARIALTAAKFCEGDFERGVIGGGDHQHHTGGEETEGPG